MIDSTATRILGGLLGTAWLALGFLLYWRAPLHPHGDRRQGAVAVFALWPARDLARALGRRNRDRLRIDDIPPGGCYLGRGFTWSPPHLQALQDAARRGFSGGSLHATGRPEERDLFLPPELLGQHLLILGTTGVGKTRMLELLATQAIRRGETTAVIDPKGDDGLLARIIDECRRAGRRLSIFAPPWPGSSLSYNPVGSFSDVREAADRVAALLPAGGDAEPFRNFGWDLVNGTASALHRLGRPVTLDALKRYGIDDPWSLLREAWPGLRDPARLVARAEGSGIPEFRALAAVALRPRDHALKMASSLLPVLAKLTSGSNRGLLSPARSGFSWKALDHDGGVAYFYLGSLLGGDSAAAIAKMALLDFQSHVGARYAYGRDPAPLSLFVDELADVATPAFVNVLNKGRGAGLRLVMAAQTQADLEAALGSRSRAEQVVGNVNTVIQFRAQSRADAEIFSSLAGDRPMAVASEGESYEPTLLSSGLKTADDFRAVFSRQRTWRDGALVPPWAVAELPVFHYFARWNGRLVKGIVPLLLPADRGPVEGMKDEARAALCGGPGAGRLVGLGPRAA